MYIFQRNISIIQNAVVIIKGQAMRSAYGGRGR